MRFSQGHQCLETIPRINPPLVETMLRQMDLERDGPALAFPSTVPPFHVAAIDLMTPPRPVDVTQQPTAAHQPLFSVKIASHSARGQPMQDLSLKYHFLGVNQSVPISRRIFSHFYLAVMPLDCAINACFCIDHWIGITGWSDACPNTMARHFNISLRTCLQLSPSNNDKPSTKVG